MRSSLFPSELCFLLICYVGTALTALATDLPTLVIRNAHTVITQSCRVIIPPDTILPDPEQHGAIQIAASNIEIEFATGSVLRGSPQDTPPDQYKGYGIRINGHKGVTIRGANISGYWCGLWAARTDGLFLEAIDASDNRHARL